MKKYKYYSVESKSKEAIRVVTASDENEAYKIASGVKSLTLEKFKKLFKISILEYGK